MKLPRLVGLVLALSLVACKVGATTITTFGNITPNQFTATDNGNGTTTLSVNTAVNITQIFAGALDPDAQLIFTASSTGDAFAAGPLWFQDYAGSFILENQAHTIDYLSGTFGGALQLGAIGGTNSLFTSNSGTLGPLVLTSSLGALANPESFSLSLANLTPTFSIDTSGGHSTFGSFSASFSGEADAALPSAVPEPASLVLLGTGLLGVAGRLRTRWRRAA